MEEDATRAAPLANLLQRLHSSDLVVDVNDRAHKCIWAHSCFQDIQVDEAFSVDGKVGHLEAFILKLAAGVQNALVVHLRRDDVTLLVAIEASKALEAQVVRLSSA